MPSSDMTTAEYCEALPSSTVELPVAIEQPPLARSGAGWPLPLSAISVGVTIELVVMRSMPDVLPLETGTKTSATLHSLPGVRTNGTVGQVLF